MGPGEIGTLETLRGKRWIVKNLYSLEYKGQTIDTQFHDLSYYECLEFYLEDNSSFGQFSNGFDWVAFDVCIGQVNYPQPMYIDPQYPTQLWYGIYTVAYEIMELNTKDFIFYYRGGSGTVDSIRNVYHYSSL